MSTVGFGDLVCITDSARALSMLAAVTGLALGKKTKYNTYIYITRSFISLSKRFEQ
jgi:hypothetical protein